MKCEFVTEIIPLQKFICSSNIEDFKYQFKELLNESKQYKSVVYILKTQKDIPRLKDKSPIIYIGKAKNGLHSRYIYRITQEANEYWKRYEYIINTYGNIYCELHKTKDSFKTEQNYLLHYHRLFMELPPINLRSFNILEPYSSFDSIII